MSSPFFTKDNEGVLQRVLYKDICRRYGGDLNEKQAQRLMKTVTYYMSEVHRVNGNKPVPFLNKEVLNAVLPDYISYLERNERTSVRSVVSDIETGPGEVQDTTPRREILDIDNAFTSLQSQRQETRAKPVMQDFQISLSEEPPLSMELFERMKKEREEASLLIVSNMQQLQLQQKQQQQQQQPQQQLTNFVEASDTFLQGNRKAQEDADALFAERERKKLEVRANISLPVPPDMRSLYENVNANANANANAASGNPTTIEPRRYETLANLPQAILTREQDIVSYRETETNLFLYSGDRDWTTNNTESRYNFTTIFDPAGLPGSISSYQTTTVPTRFRNIVRIEFIKAIIPGESLDPLITKSSSNVYVANTSMNALSFPYIQVRIPELETNSYGTNQGITSSFALLQYDANWINDTNIGTQRGYFAMIPKFMKCQKVYTTPLSTLQRLSIQLQRPDGNVLSSSPDTLDIKTIYPTIAINTGVFTGGGAVNTIYKRDTAVDISGSAYYWIQTSKYFSTASFSVGDRVSLKNITWANWTPLSPIGTQLAQLSTIIAFLQNTQQVVVSLGTITGTGTASTFSDASTQGYFNAIIVRGQFPDPTTGVFTPVAPGGVDDSSTATAGSSANYLINNQLTTGRILNQSHQVHIAMRVITRDIDSTGVIRSDNL